MKSKFFMVLVGTFYACLFTLKAQTNFAQYVDPMIGTGGHGHTFPGATVPFGMVQLSPDTRIDNSWDGCSGYHYSDSLIYGFSHTHLSGTGCSDYGDIALLPFSDYKNGDDQNPDGFSYVNYAQKFDHKNEKASAGYYSVKLNSGINVELTATTRVGFHKYTFPAGKESQLVVQLDHRDKTLESDLKKINNKTLEGFRRSEAWAKDQYIYFVIEFSEPVVSEGGVGQGNEKGVMKALFERFSFGRLNGKPLYVKVGISTVSIEGARKNLEQELPGWDFEKTRKDAEQLWNKELSKIEVTSQDKDRLHVFYTALYHTMIQPNVNMDVDGMYRGRDNKIHKAEGFTYYSVFSLWDTFRAAHPLYTIIDQKRTSDFINTFLAQYEQGGRLPVWELASNETDCMIGYHSVSVIADAVVKGIKGFDYEKALEACKHSAMLDHYGLKAYRENGLVSMDDEHESVSKTVEYAYDDWCIAQIAKVLNKTEDYSYFMKRSQSWKNVFDPETGFMRPRKNGGWLIPFEPREVNNNYTEGNSWQYTFFAPHDLHYLIEMMRGKEDFERKLDELFSAPAQTTGREQADITGLIGQYAHGNEPSHHMAYLYDYVEKPQKTQERIGGILRDFYKPLPDGLIGNEDCGQMSAWYVLSATGIYEVCPGSSQFVFGSPLFKSVKINLENGKSFTFDTKNYGEKNYYISGAALNDKLYAESFITYKEIEEGGKLTFDMTDKSPAVDPFTPIPLTVEKENVIVIDPIIHAGSKVFKGRMKVDLKSIEPGDHIYYTLDGSVPSASSILYSQTFFIDTTTIVKAIAVNAAHKQSLVSTGTFYKMPHPDWKIKISGVYNSQYTAGGDEGIIDGIHGTENWRKGEWQGYQSKDFEVVIDFGKEQTVSSVSSTYLQDTKSWIIFPKAVKYSFSDDGINFKNMVTVLNTVDAKELTSQVENLSKVLEQKIKARYVKIKAINYGKLPEWHQGAGGDAFIFVDEIEIK